MIANEKTTTLFLPLKDKSEFALEALKYYIEVSPCKILVMYEEGLPEDYIVNDKVSYVKNTSGRCYSKIHNNGIKHTDTEFVILTAWRSRPTIEHFHKVFEKLSEGYAVVDLCLMHFTSFGKDVLSKIGWFDEGFIFGHCEDWDFYNRIIMSKLAAYITNEVPEVKKETTWTAGRKIGPFNAENYEYYMSKWKKINRDLYLMKKEVNFKDRFFYENQYSNFKYLDNKHTFVEDSWVKKQHFDAIDRVIDETQMKFFL